MLSELRQNADDAGATEASVQIVQRDFIFEHNGDDFNEEHFASLCCFGYSNKRVLHTIGFRGVGFNSTFSLGDRVELFTPTLSVCFCRKRFTEPQWLPERVDTGGRTRIRVKIGDQYRQQEVEKNLRDWSQSPVALLFFNNIRRVQIGEQDLRWRALGQGPIPESEWMSLDNEGKEKFLLIRSKADAFPEEALAEIRLERMLGTREQADFPPCRIEIVLGARGRLYVVLPTDIETNLTFACNAPFMQDPARLKIKDPEVSPTNRWLLERIGKLVGSAMLRWLGQTETPAAERARAYALLPNIGQEDRSVHLCGTIVRKAFADVIEGKPLLLTEGGQLTPAKRSVIIPSPVLDVWEAEKAAALLDEQGRPPLHRHIRPADRKKLVHWGIVDEIDKKKLLEVLQTKHLPKPRTWCQLLRLWAYIEPEITSYRGYVNPEDMRIVPVQGRDTLQAAREVVRLGEKKLLQSEDDWKFLARYLIVLNQDWPRVLAKQQRKATERKDRSPCAAVEAARAVMEKIGLHEVSDASKVMNQIAVKFFSQQSASLKESVQLAQIAAKLGAKVGQSFRYFTRDGVLRSTEENVFYDKDGALEELLPEGQRQAQLLHSEYSAAFRSWSRQEWEKWVDSGRACLHTFIPFVKKRDYIYDRRRIEEEAHRRGLSGDLSYRYQTSSFQVEDWDFEAAYWKHWEALAAEDSRVWVKIVERISARGDWYSKQGSGAQIWHVSRTGGRKPMTSELVVPAWALRLRKLPCLPDTRGFPHKPPDLLRRAPETEPLLDVEPFVHRRIDGEVARPLLDLLGVQSVPTGPDRLLDCLRALAKAKTPPTHEVEKWYRRLDQMVPACSTLDFQKIKQAFQSERLILTEDGAWVAAGAVSLSSNEEDVPGAAVIRPSVRDLMLWRKLGVADRPTADRAIEWLKTLPSSSLLPEDDARRVPEEIGKVFASRQIQAALDYSFERSEQDIREYIFKLSRSPEACGDQQQARYVHDGQQEQAVSATNVPERQGATAESTREVGVLAQEQDVEGTVAPVTPYEQPSEVVNELEPKVLVEQPEYEAAAKPSVVGGVGTPRTRQLAAPKPTNPSIMERFAKAQGFQKDSEERFRHEDGSWIGRTHGESFPWERRTAEGRLLQYYWPRDHCLEREPLQIGTDLWGMIQQRPDMYSLILADGEGKPVELPGRRLCEMVERGLLNLYPATYRLGLAQAEQRPEECT